MPERWHAWPVARVFPGSVPGTSPSGARVTYVLAGVAPEAPCRVAFQPGVLRLLRGCVTALRATYTDSTQTFVATVGIAVLTTPAAHLPAEPPGGDPPSAPPETGGGRLSDRSSNTGSDRPPSEPSHTDTGCLPGGPSETGTGTARLPGRGPETGTGPLPETGARRLPELAATAGAPVDRSGTVVGRPPTVRPVAFPDGPAERFGESQYVTGALISSNDAYVVATAAGYADGRPYKPGDLAARRLGDTARRLATVLHRSLTR
ncbi:hypothetical protein AB0F17_64030 [Nonomuraea sp. NPDC026600]|uniref:hypothetical protein n=1 Tax=Nonomuraea sp. NPDC026600 TaxID=3155363 RepID=UPI00340A68A2